jgi:hypothetical protein
VSPILGIWASQNYPRITNSYESIQTVTVGAGGQSSISFTSIPSTYKNLEIRFFAYSTRQSGNDIDDYNIRFNSDTGSSYAYHYLAGEGVGSAFAGSTSSATAINSVTCVGTLKSNSYISGGAIISVIDYANTSKFKTMRLLGGADMNGDGAGDSPGRVGMVSGLWQSTSAITSINMYCTNGNWGQYSSFGLYGIKG